MLQDDLILLEGHLNKLHVPVTKYLHTGLSDTEVINELNCIKLSATEEIIHLYKWKNGAHPDSTLPLGEFLFIPGYFFLPLSKACEQYQLMADFDDWQKTWLPILSNGNGDFFAADLTASFTSPTPIIDYLLPDPDTPIAFQSIANMIRVFIMCFEQNAFFVDSKTGYLDADDDAWGTIAKKLNPYSPCW